MLCLFLDTQFIFSVSKTANAHYHYIFYGVSFLAYSDSKFCFWICESYTYNRTSSSLKLMCTWVEGESVSYRPMEHGFQQGFYVPRSSEAGSTYTAPHNIVTSIMSFTLFINYYYSYNYNRLITFFAWLTNHRTLRPICLGAEDRLLCALERTA
jgi:hypothetical protein